MIFIHHFRISPLVTHYRGYCRTLKPNYLARLVSEPWLVPHKHPRPMDTVLSQWVRVCPRHVISNLCRWKWDAVGTIYTAELKTIAQSSVEKKAHWWKHVE